MTLTRWKNTFYLSRNHLCWKMVKNWQLLQLHISYSPHHDCSECRWLKRWSWQWSWQQIGENTLTEKLILDWWKLILWLFALVGWWRRSDSDDSDYWRKKRWWGHLTMTGRLTKASIQVFLRKSVWIKFWFEQIFQEMTCDNKEESWLRKWRQPDPTASWKKLTCFQKKEKNSGQKIQINEEKISGRLSKINPLEVVFFLFKDFLAPRAFQISDSLRIKIVWVWRKTVLWLSICIVWSIKKIIIASCK